MVARPGSKHDSRSRKCVVYKGVLRQEFSGLDRTYNAYHVDLVSGVQAMAVTMTYVRCKQHSSLYSDKGEMQLTSKVVAGVGDAQARRGRGMGGGEEGEGVWKMNCG